MAARVRHIVTTPSMGDPARAPSGGSDRTAEHSSCALGQGEVVSAFAERSSPKVTPAEAEPGAATAATTNASSTRRSADLTAPAYDGLCLFSICGRRSMYIFVRSA